MAQRCANLVKVHNIPKELIDTDETCIHLVRTKISTTWKTKGAKYIKVHGTKNKRHVIVNVSFAANGHCLFFEVIFQGTTTKPWPKLQGGRKECELSEWNIFYSHNHWSPLQTCKEFVDRILRPYLDAQMQQMALPANQEMIWLIDYWSAHISKEFWDWMKKHHLDILVLCIPTNCTIIYQPAYVVIQCIFKHAFRQEFNKFTMDIISNQLKGGEDVQMNFKMSKLKPQLCPWLYKA